MCVCHRSFPALTPTVAPFMMKSCAKMYVLTYFLKVHVFCVSVLFRYHINYIENIFCYIL